MNKDIDILSNKFWNAFSWAYAGYSGQASVLEFDEAQGKVLQYSILPYQAVNNSR